MTNTHHAERVTFKLIASDLFPENAQLKISL